jgi:uncharacterized protein (UPF0371 family)
MGVNRAGFGIVDDQVVREAARQEVIRRYFRYACEYAMGFAERTTLERVELLLNDLNLKPEDRKVVVPAGQAADRAREKGKGNEGIFCGAAIELRDGRVVTGENSPLMHAASALILNTTKQLAGIPREMDLLPPNIIASLSHLKKDILKGRMVSLDLEETLIALSISSAMNPGAQMAVEKLKDLRGCEVHLTHIPSPGDAAGFRKLGVNLTSAPNFATKLLFIS